jgi:hypothetical protein
LHFQQFSDQYFTGKPQGPDSDRISRMAYTAGNLKKQEEAWRSAHELGPASFDDPHLLIQAVLDGMEIERPWKTNLQNQLLGHASFKCSRTGTNHFPDFSLLREPQ